MILKGRKVVGGNVEGVALVSVEPVSFYGGVDPDTGCITEPGHCCCGENITGKVFVFPTGKGSTVGSYVMYRMKKIGTLERLGELIPPRDWSTSRHGGPRRVIYEELVPGSQGDEEVAS